MKNSTINCTFNMTEIASIIKEICTSEYINSLDFCLDTYSCKYKDVSNIRKEVTTKLPFYAKKFEIEFENKTSKQSRYTVYEAHLISYLYLCKSDKSSLMSSWKAGKPVEPERVDEFFVNFLVFLNNPIFSPFSKVYEYELNILKQKNVGIEDSDIEIEYLFNLKESLSVNKFELVLISLTFNNYKNELHEKLMTFVDDFVDSLSTNNLDTKFYPIYESEEDFVIRKFEESGLDDSKYDEFYENLPSRNVIENGLLKGVDYEDALCEMMAILNNFPFQKLKKDLNTLTESYNKIFQDWLDNGRPTDLDYNIRTHHLIEELKDVCYDTLYRQNRLYNWEIERYYNQEKMTSEEYEDYMDEVDYKINKEFFKIIELDKTITKLQQGELNKMIELLEKQNNKPINLHTFISKQMLSDENIYKNTDTDIPASNILRYINEILSESSDKNNNQL